ncbi:MAG: hypothetical protein P4L53_16030 [Candidatus Obscuribacterales bacterium]|nr:hypothetical protein [Candidatus Obscuribacterales bacterium]
MADLNIAEIPYETGEIHFRYSRRLSEDESRWIRHGLFVEYHLNGKVASEGTYVDGAEHGNWREYYETGNLAAEGRYENGQETGNWKYWNEDGTPCDD